MEVKSPKSRRIIAALQVSLDGLIEGPNGDLDWIGSWEDSFDLLPEIDTCVLGGRMYPGYERYWLAILANPEGILPLTGQVPARGEVEYARFADKTLTSSCRGHSTRSPGRRRGSCGMWKTSER